MPSYPDLLDYRRQAGEIGDFLGVDRRGVLLNGSEGVEMLSMHLVTENYFQVLGVHAAEGRTLSDSDAHFDGAPPVVISYGLWQRKFGGSAAVVGQPILLNSHGFYIAGVAPREFHGVGLEILPPDIWMPFSAASVREPGALDRMMKRDYRGINVLLRLRDGIPQARAEAALTAVAARLANDYPDTNKGRAVVLSPAAHKGMEILGGILLSLVGLVLLIACANITGILLAQGEARRHEFAVRLALGATRRRLIRQMIVETLLLALAAAGLGLLLAVWLIRLLPAIQPALPIPVNYDLRIDVRAFAYTLLLALIATAAAGLAPALRLSKPQLGAARGRFRLRGWLMVAQIATAQFLLSGAGLLVRSYLEIRQLRPGFDPARHVLFATVIPNSDRRDLDFPALLDKIRAVPGVRSTSSIRNLPLGGSGTGAVPVIVPELGPEPIDVGMNAVSPDYFTAMGSRILRGRDFNQHDPRGTAVVNETMARRCWGSADRAIGRFLRVGGRDVRVVGIVEDGKYRWLLEDPSPYVFVASPGETNLVIETAGDPGALTPAVRNALKEAAPGWSVSGLVTLRQHLRLALFAWQAGAALVATFAILGIFLAGVGLYGQVAHSVNCRAHEIGVRVALGARPADILRLVTGQAVAGVAIGAVLGLAAALAAARVISAALYHVSPADPIALITGVLAIASVTVLAAQLPARRAARLDPMTVLRRD